MLILRASRFPQFRVLQILLLLKVVPSNDNRALLFGAGDHNHTDTVQGVTRGCNHLYRALWIKLQTFRLQFPACSIFTNTFFKEDDSPVDILVMDRVSHYVHLSVS